MKPFAKKSKKVYVRFAVGFLRSFFLLLLCISLAGADTAFACTTIIVGKKASADGSIIFGRTADTHGLSPVRFEYREAREDGAFFTDPSNGFSCPLPGNACGYLTMPGIDIETDGSWDEATINDHGVCISATESIYTNEKAKAADPLVDDGIGEQSIHALTAPYIHTAREGVEYLGKLIDQYGNADEGNGVIFGDRDEVWYMEIYAGHQWAAVRIPDDCYVIAPNDGRIGKIDVTDTENVIVSAHLVELAKEGGFFVGNGNVIDTTRTYCTELRNYSQIRAWETQRKFSPSSTPKTYDVNTYYPFALKPDQKISLEDVMELCRWRYEGTEYDVNEHPEVRAIGINRTRQTSIFWLRPDKPEIMWNCFANPEMSVFLPMYKNTKVFPEAYSLAPTKTYDEQTAYYRFLRTGILAADDRGGFGKKVRKSWKDMQKDLIDKTEKRDTDYIANSCSDDAAAQIFDSIGTKALEQADQLYFEGMTDWLDSRMQDGGSDSPDAAYENINN